MTCIAGVKREADLQKNGDFFMSLTSRGKAYYRLAKLARSSSTVSDWLLSTGLRASRQHLRSASRRLLVVPPHRLSRYGRRAFAVAGPTAWNSLPDKLRDPDVTIENFKGLMKTFCFQRTSAISAL